MPDAPASETAGSAGAERIDTAAPGLGAAIYAQGRGERDRPVPARHAAGAWRLRGSVVACANCHGLQRDGGREGAVKAPSLRWVDTAREARAQLHAALTSGLSRDGRTLDATMPRFELEDAEFEALYAYLQQANAQGTGTAELPLYVTLFPAPERRLPAETLLLQGLQKCFDPIAGGAAPSLRWQLRTYSSAEGALAAWRQAAGDPGVAALVAPSLRGWSQTWAAELRRQPATDEPGPLMIFPFIDDPVESVPAQSVVWLFGGQQERQHVIRQVWETRKRAIADAEQSTEELATWVASPARINRATTQADSQISSVWADAACTAVMAMQQRALSAPGAMAGSPAQRMRWALRRTGRLETGLGLMLEPDRRVAVNDWSIWALRPPAPPTLVEPRARLERGAGPSGPTGWTVEAN